jgi:hypothetical protein
MYGDRRQGMTLTDLKQNYPQAVMAVVGAVILLGSAVGGFLFIDGRYANAEQSIKTMQMLQQSIIKTNAKIDMESMQRRRDALDEQLWRIENRCGTTVVMQMPAAERDRYRRMKKQRDTLTIKLNAMEAMMAPPLDGVAE